MNHYMLSKLNAACRPILIGSFPRMDMETALMISEEFRRRFKGRKFPATGELIREDRAR